MESTRLQREQTNSEPDQRTTRSAPPSRQPEPGFLVFETSPPRLRIGTRNTVSVQAKLNISQPGDQYEQEADRVAEQVMRMPDPALRLQRKCSCGGATTSGASCVECGGRSAPVLRRSPSANTKSASTAPPVVHQVLRSPGQPLDQSTRNFFESRMGHDFSGVRVHTSADAAKSASAIAARAYTVNSNIVFGAGEYAPQTESGRRLLSHELTHVVQQGSHHGEGDLVQRAEVDDRSCAGLTDIESDVDTKVNSEIAAARTAAGTPIPMAAFLKDVAKRLGGFTPISPIEKFIESLPATKRAVPSSSLAGTKYAGVGSEKAIYMVQAVAHVVGSAAKINGICVGADKLGHFFEEGFIYFEVMSYPGLTKTDAESTGRALEIGIQGLASTGVYSNADQAANLAGSQFYKDLKAAPTAFKFSIKNYITSAWNEQSNPSFYESGVAGVVWKNLLDGSWQGSFTSAGGKSSPIDAKVNLLATTAGDVAGVTQWPAAKPTNVERIKNGKITQKTTSVTGVIPGKAAVSDTPVTGISIDFDWEAKTVTGKGTWNSVDEQTLEGTWGIGTSRTDGGTWKLKKG